MQVSLDANQVYTFKLNSGEEMIAKVIQTNDNFVFIEEPVSIAPGPQGMGLVPSMFTADVKEAIKLNMNCVAIIGHTEDSVKMKYIEATTGIKVPEKKILVG